MREIVKRALGVAALGALCAAGGCVDESTGIVLCIKAPGAVTAISVQYRFADPRADEGWQDLGKELKKSLPGDLSIFPENDHFFADRFHLYISAILADGGGEVAAVGTVAFDEARILWGKFELSGNCFTSGAPDEVVKSCGFDGLVTYDDNVCEGQTDGSVPDAGPDAAEDAWQDAWQDAWEDAAQDVQPPSDALYDGGCSPPKWAASCSDAGCLIPPGCFFMGPALGECTQAYEDTARHAIKLTHWFTIGETEVTRGQFEAKMGYARVQKPSGPACEAPNPARCPVNGVSWEEAVEYCNRLDPDNACYECDVLDGRVWPNTDADTDAGYVYEPNDGGIGVLHGACRRVNDASIYACKGYRLPTEAEWEYAARAGSYSALPPKAGNDGGGELPKNDSGCVNTHENAEALAVYGGDDISDVGFKPANHWGLLGIRGNLREWVLDIYSTGYDQVSPNKNPLILHGNDRHVLKGGSFKQVAGELRPAYRRFYPEEYYRTEESHGFRCVRVVNPD